MAKPLLFQAASFFGRLAGRAESVSLLNAWMSLLSPLSPPERNIKSMLRRIMAHQGQSPDPARIASIVRESRRHMAEMIVSLVILDEIEARRLSAVTDLDILPVIRRLREKGKGVILAGPHFGNQVAALSALCLAGIPVHAQIINAPPYEWTRLVGLRVISLGFGAAQCARALGDNEVVLLYTDLDFFPQGRTVEFFGAPIRPPHGPPRLASYCAAPILPYYPVSQDGRHRVLFDEPILPEQKTPEDMEVSILRSMERFIAKYPEQWWVGKDIWDIAETDKTNHAHLRMLNWVRQVSGLAGR